MIAMETQPEAVVFPAQTSPKFVGTDNYKVSVPVVNEVLSYFEFSGSLYCRQHLEGF